MNKYIVEDHEVLSFQNEKELAENINNVDMLRITNEEVDPDNEKYVFTLENNDTIIVSMNNKSKLMLHVSVNNNQYKPVVNENEDNDNLDIEYIGFQLI